MAEIAVQQLKDEAWIASDFQELEFTVDDSVTGDPIDLTTFQKIGWVLYPYGDPDNPILNLSGVVVAEDHSKFNVYIDSDYTKDLEGMYQQQPFLIDSSKKEFRPALGNIDIKARGNGENSKIID